MDLALNNLERFMCYKPLENKHDFIYSDQGSLMDTTALSQGGPRSNGNDGVLSIIQNTKTGASQSDSV